MSTVLRAECDELAGRRYLRELVVDFRQGIMILTQRQRATSSFVRTCLPWDSGQRAGGRR